MQDLTPTSQTRSTLTRVVGLSVFVGFIVLMLVGCGVATPSARTAGNQAWVGKSLDLAALDLETGKTISTKGLRGKVVLVDFWASWCAPCRESLRFYESLRAQYEERGFEVMAIGVDTERALAERFAARQSVNFPMLWDRGQQAVAKVDVDAMPTSLLVARDGTVLAVHSGFDESTRAQLTAELERLLPVREAPPAR